MSGAVERLGFLEERTLQVAVVPVLIDDAKFATYCALLQSLATVDLRDVTRAQTRWKTGHVIFRFHAYRAPRSEWEDFQLYRKTVAVLGFGDCGRAGLSALSAAFEAAAAEYPVASHKRLLAVDPPEMQAEALLGDAVVVPTGLGPERTSVLVQSHVAELASRVLVEFESSVFLGDPFGRGYIATALDPSRTGDDVRMLKKKLPLRVAKARGDWCLQAGQPEAALEFYARAAEEGKLLSDWEWVAGSLEGQCCALVALHERSPDAVEHDVMAKANEAIFYYSKRGAPMLELELYLRVAHYQVLLGHKERAADWLSQAHALADANVDTQDRIRIAGAIAGVFLKMGFRRKYAFFLWLAATLYRKLLNPASSLSIMKSCARHHFLDALLSREDNLLHVSVERPPVQAGRQPLFAEHGWGSIQLSLLLDFVSLCKQLHDSDSVARYAQYALRSYSHLLSPALQNSLFIDILEASSTMDRQVNLIGVVLPLPTLLELVPLCLHGNNVPIEIKRKASASPFLYSPIQMKREVAITPVTWVASETCEIDLAFFNPLSLDICVTDVQLCTSGPSVECFPLPITIPAGAKKKATVLCRVSGGAGELVIHGCITQALGVRSYTPLHANGLAFNELEFYSHKIDFSSPSEIIGRKVTVIDPMPLVELRKVGACETSVLQLVEHQLHEVHLELENIGASPARFLEMDVSAPGGDCSVVGWSEEKLPLMPLSRVPFQLAIRATQQVKTVLLTVKYSERGTEGFERSHTSQLRVSVGPSISIERVHAAVPEGVPSECHLSIDVANRSSAESFFLCCASSLPGARLPGSAEIQSVVGPKEARTCVIRFLRVPFDGSDDDDNNDELLSFVRREVMPRIALRWTMPSLQRGEVSLEHAELAAPLARAICAAPVSLEMSMLLGDRKEEVAFHETAPPQPVALSAPFQIVVTARNQTRSRTLGPLLLRVSIASGLGSNSSSGTIPSVPAATIASAAQNSVTGRVATTGSLQKLVEHLAPGTATIHALSAIVLEPGAFAITATVLKGASELAAFTTCICTPS